MQLAHQAQKVAWDDNFRAKILGSTLDDIRQVARPCLRWQENDKADRRHEA